MATIIDILNTTRGKEMVQIAGEQTSESEENINLVLSMALPIIVGAMMNNVATPAGTKDLNNILVNENYKDQGFEKLKQNGSTSLINEGEKILESILGTKQKDISSLISTVTTINEQGVTAIFKIATPFIINILSMQKEIEKIDADDLGSLLSSALGSSSQYDNSLIDTILKKGNDGSIIEDINGMILGGGNKGKGGSILGGMLGGK